MIRAKDLESMADSLSHLGLPFKEFMFQQKIDYTAKELNFNILDATDSEPVNYRFTINKELSGDYSIEDYDASMIIVPMEHGRFENVNTQALENEMKEIKWALFPLYQKEALLPLFKKLDLLRNSDDKKAKDIGNKLAIKYFSNTPLENMLPLPDKRQFEKRIIIPIHNAGNDVDMAQAVRLLKGETLLKFVDTKNDTAALCWLKEERGYLKVYPDFDVSEVIKQMPFVKQPDIIEQSEMLASLGNGKTYPESLLINKRVVEGFISVDAAGQSLEFRDKEGKDVKWKLWRQVNQSKKPGKGKKGPGL